MGISEFWDMMPHTIILHGHSGYNKAGDPLPGADTTHRGYVEGKAIKVVTPSGVEKTSTAIVYLGEYLDIPLETTVTLPSGFQPRERLHILNIAQQADESGPFNVILFLS